MPFFKIARCLSGISRTLRVFEGIFPVDARRVNKFLLLSRLLNDGCTMDLRLPSPLGDAALFSIFTSWGLWLYHRSVVFIVGRDLRIHICILILRTKVTDKKKLEEVFFFFFFFNLTFTQSKGNIQDTNLIAKWQTRMEGQF